MIDIKDFRKQLSEGIVEFKFTKKDGSIREARGTTNPDIISEFVKPITSDKPKRDIKISDNSTRYFDIDSKGWRSFVNENLIG